MKASSLRKTRIEIGVVWLKNYHAKDIARREAALIAHDMGFSKARILSQEEIISLIPRIALDIPKNERSSFFRADLIMEATDQDGQICYIATEISFTANEKDTRRAIRNAAFLTRFTGKRAYAVVAGMSKDERIQSIIELEDVFWYQLEAEDH